MMDSNQLAFREQIYSLPRPSNCADYPNLRKHTTKPSESYSKEGLATLQGCTHTNDPDLAADRSFIPVHRRRATVEV